MESDLSLIGMLGNDESLLQQIPPDDIANFACSPLRLPRSHTSSSSTISVTKTSAGSRGLGNVSSCCNKENLNAGDNKSGILNLSIEPQKMKRSKKGGGYNLRKSLAWDRAFLTEEGVLNSSELSMITGTPDEKNEQGRDFNSIVGSTDMKTFEEDLFNEMPSGNINESSSFLKWNSLNRGSLASGSKSLQKIPPQSKVSKTEFKGGVTSTPVARASQKRLLNIGTAKIVTRNSKIPKFPVSKLDTCLAPMTNSKISRFSVSKQDTCFPSMTATHGASGRCSKSIGIAQRAQNDLSSKVSSNIRIAFSATKLSSDCTSESSKLSAEIARKDMEMPNLEMNLLMNHQAQHTTKMSIHSEMTSNKALSTGGGDVVKSIGRISSTTVSSHHNSDSVDGNRKDVQRLGRKPSGLRMPSPSLSFFELKVPVLNASSKGDIRQSNLLKPTLPSSKNPRAADHVEDLKPAHLLQGVIKYDATGKAGLSSQMIDKCSTSSILDPKTDYEVIRDGYNQQEVQVQVPVGAKTEKQANDKQSRCRVLDDSGKQCMAHVPTSQKDEGSDRKDGKLLLSHLESVEATHKTSIVSLIGDENISENSFESCRDVQLSGASETIREVQPQLVEDLGYNSSVMNDEVVPGFQTDSIDHYNNLTLAANSGPSSSMFDDNRPSEESNICNFSQIINEGNMDVRVDGEHLLRDDTSSLKLDEGDSIVLVCDDRDVAVEKSDASVAYTQCTEVTNDVKIQVDEKHVFRNELLVKEIIPQSNEPGLNDSTLLEHSTPEHNQEEKHAGIIDNIDNKVYNSLEKVDQIDSLTLLSSNSKYTTDEAGDLEFHLSAMRSKDQVASLVAISDTEKSCYPDNRHELPPRHMLMNATVEEHIEHDTPGKSVSSREPETRTSQDDEKNIDCTDKKDTNSKLRTSEDGQNLTVLAPNVIPFSDEWLAAIEAAGEEILTMKTGAVQNSPPDKSIPEPGPWSPVKKKSNQLIGPYDCTKYRNTQHSSE